MAANNSSTNFSTAILIRVDQSGQGDFKKIQDAIDAVPSNNTELFFIWVKPGTYRFVVILFFFKRADARVLIRCYSESNSRTSL